MVAQVLADLQDLEAPLILDQKVFSKLRNYTKPIKTRHLAKRMSLDANVLVQSLNRLRTKNLICYHVPKRLDDKKYYGWIVV